MTTKEAAEKKSIVKLMRCKTFCDATFLGPNEDLDKLIEEDNKVLKSYGVTHKQICDILKSVLQVYDSRYSEKPGYRHLRNSATKGNTIYDVKGKTCLGSQPCPFEVYGIESCARERRCCQSEIVVKKVNVDDRKKWIASNFEGEENCQELTFGSLLIHLIEEHQFFEGKELLYRLDPAKTIEFFGLKPNVNYENWFQSADTELASHYSSIPSSFLFLQGTGGLVYTS